LVGTKTLPEKSPYVDTHGAGLPRPYMKIFMENIGRFLMFGGIILFLVGRALFLAGKFGLPLGRLPGDIRIEGQNGSFYFPVTTSILVSIVLTVILNLIGRFLKK
jgi:hypothetical protein